jgi:hypothetical protein
MFSMILCCSCRHVSPKGSRYCGYCSRSLNVTYCPDGHENSRGVLCCTTCGTPQLSEGTRALRLHWLGSLVTAGLLVGAWKLTLPHLGTLLSWLFGAGLGVAGFLLNTTPACLQATALRGLSWLFTLWLLGQWLGVLPGKGGALGQFLRDLPRLALRTLPRLLCQAGRLLAALVRRLF